MLLAKVSLPEQLQKERTTWFSMWFLGSVASFGAAFFPMYYRLVDNRNKHFRREAELEKHIAEYLRAQGKDAPKAIEAPPGMNAKAWAASIVLVVPVFFVLYFLSRDLMVHEKHEDEFLVKAFPQRLFMPQTIPIKKYIVLTIVTLGAGGVYWLYKIVNNYNAHFKAQWQVEAEITRLMEEKPVGK